MAGVAVVHRPRAYPPAATTQAAILLQGFISLWSPAAFGRWLKLLAALEKRHPTEPHYYLEFVGVHPAFQGRGLGSLMLQRVTGWADEQSVGCYLETSNPRNVPLYRRFGFQTTAEAEIMGVPLWFMWRPPAAADRA
jgi:ribosomal protein S18 acetylase RimI-like enzyme